jgi:hypothetical protein
VTRNVTRTTQLCHSQSADHTNYYEDSRNDAIERTPLIIIIIIVDDWFMLFLFVADRC